MSELDVFPVAIGEYLHHDYLDVEPEVDRVVELFKDFGGFASSWDIPMADRDRSAVAARLRSWAGGPEGNTVLYWVGHGWSDRDDATLAHAKSPKDVKEDGVSPSAVARHIAKREASSRGDAWTIVVIDACRSARFVELLNAEVDNYHGPRRLLLVGVSGEGSTNLGRFTATLRVILGDIFHTDQEIGLWQLAHELDRNLQGGQVFVRKNLHDAALRRAGAPIDVTAPLDVVAEVKAVMAGLTDDERRHFVPKAQGAEFGELSWYFEGRCAERARIVFWLRDPPKGLLVITGDAGSGKSALLGHLVVQSRPQLRQVIERHNLTAELPANERPPDNAFDAVLHLTGLGSAEVASRLAADLAVGEIPAEVDPREQVTWLCSAVEGKPRTILVDALDEAVSPLTVARAVLRPLAAVPSVRVIVGTRRSTQDGPDRPRTDDRDLLNALGAADDATVVVERDVMAIARYVHRRLTAAVSRGLLRADDVTITEAAAVIGATGQQFLFARLAVHEIIARPELLTEAGLPELLTADHRQLFATAVTRLSRDRPINRPLLQALAYSRGRGLPMRDGVWSAMASALAGDEEVTAADAGLLLKLAAPYVMLDREHGQTVYRLAHRTFAEHFTVETVASDEVHPDHRRRHRAVVLRLIAEAEADPAAELNPYLAHYLSAHIGAAGEQAWHHLAERPGLLDRLDPNAVGADAMRTAFGRFPLPVEIAGVIGACHVLARSAHSDRPGLRQLAMTRYTGILRPGASGGTDGFTWTVLWASVVRQSTHLTLIGHTSWVTAVAAVRGPHGRMLLASGSGDGTVRLWDPAIGTAVGEPLTGHTRGVTAVAAVRGPHGRMLLASGSGDGIVRLWDPAIGTAVGELLTGHTSGVTAVAAVRGPYGRMLLASGSDDGTVRLWDPAIGTAVGEPLTGHTSGVTAVAAVRGPYGRMLLASGSDDGTVRLWDPAGTAVGEPLTGHTGSVWAVAAVPGLDGHTLLATGGADHTVRLWDPATGTPVGKTLTGHTGGVLAVAAVPGPDGHTLLATGGGDGTVRLWDPATGFSVGDPLRGHTGWVTGLAVVGGPRGRTLLASGGGDGTVRLWDPATGFSVGDPLRGHTGWVTGLAVVGGPRARTLLASGGDDGTVRLWDPATGISVGDPLRGHTGKVWAVAAVPGPRGRTLLASGGDDATVRLWDPATGISVGDPLTGHTGSVSAVAAVPGPRGRTLLATGGEDGMVWLWDPATGTPVSVLYVGVDLLALCSLPAGRLAAGTSEGVVVLVVKALVSGK